MNRVAPFALVAAGRIRDSFLTRVPRLAERLGPVRSSSFRLASRISNFLGAGYSVESLEAFERSRVILIAMPKPWLPVVVEQLAGTGFDWKSKSVLLCDSELDSSALEALARLGASTGSIVAVPPGTEPVYLVEGERRALRVRLNDLVWSLEGSVLTLSFWLPPGSYATSVLREIVKTNA